MIQKEWMTSRATSLSLTSLSTGRTRVGISLMTSPRSLVCAWTPMVHTASSPASQLAVSSLYWKSQAHCLPITVTQTSGSSYCVSRMAWSRAVKAKKPSTRISGTTV